MKAPGPPVTAALAWSSWGPYHFARLRACRERSADHVNFVGLGLAQGSVTYAWQAESGHSDSLRILQRTVAAEHLSVQHLLPLLSRWWCEVHPDIVFIPSYWPKSSAILLAICALTGTPAVMMNDTHAGSTDTASWKMFFKWVLVRLFSGALLAGRPHCRFFASLGLPPARMRIGYDVVDNDYFERAAERVRRNRDEVRQRWALPERFILSLGRLVAKKNLTSIVRAYARLPERGIVGLVCVGSGEEGAGLRALAAELGLKVIDGPQSDGFAHGTYGTVYFFPFQQLASLPDFYALADVFVLASHVEEWGLVVNEAMASATPVVISSAVGCAEDLVRDGLTGRMFDPQQPAELTGVLRELIVDPAGTRELGQRGQAHVRRHFGCEQFSQAANELANGLLQERRGGGCVI